MKIRFLEDTNIRKAPHLTGDPPIGVMYKGSEIEVEPNLAPGDAIQDIDRWYHDQNGWYYWSGRAETVAEDQPAPTDETIGGVMVMPAQPETAHPVGSPAIPQVLPPLANDDALLSHEAIPPGETRLVPPLEVLLAAEEHSRTGAALPPPVHELEPVAGPPVVPDEAVLESTRDIAIAQSVPDFPAFWQNATPQKLNWAVQNYRIARDWWQQRHLTGKGVSIAILGTGVPPDHTDLGNQAGFFQFPDDANPMADRHGLGTQAAVIAAGTGPSVFGVAPEARLLIGKIGEQDHLITAEGLIAGLRWAIDAGADVVAMLADLPDIAEDGREELQALIDQATARGMLLVAPVGTQDNKKPESRYPARMTGVLSVGAHDVYGQRSNFSARSYDLDLLAPGEGLLTSSPRQQPGSNLKSASIAAAFTAGFLALIRQWQREQYQETAKETVFDLLRETAVSRRSFNKGEDVEYGHGILNPPAVLKKLDTSYTGADQP
jgi:major intracellular serine protease